MISNTFDTFKISAKTFFLTTSFRNAIVFRFHFLIRFSRYFLNWNIVEDMNDYKVDNFFGLTNLPALEKRGAS